MKKLFTVLTLISFVMMCFHSAHAQYESMLINGKVNDEKGESL